MSKFIKYENNPVLGDIELGTCFDAYVTKDNGKYRMDFSWRPKKSLAVSFSDDGINWSKPQITLAFNMPSGWENDVNRNCVLKIDGKYKMWYTGQADDRSYIGYAESDDGINFTRVRNEPVMVSEFSWEYPSVMNPCIIYEDGVYKMWYAAGNTYEPDVLSYATSCDGIVWEKYASPILSADPANVYEQNRIGGCQVIHTDDMGYLMFYIGYETIDDARICVACSDNGITNWKKSPYNPIVVPTPNKWDGDACYKPTVIWNNEQNLWMLWYNGRCADNEYIGYAYKKGRNLFI